MRLLYMPTSHIPEVIGFPLIAKSQGHEVKIFAPNFDLSVYPYKESPGKGSVEQVLSWREHLPWAEWAILGDPSYSRYYPVFRAKGIPTLGCTPGLSAFHRKYSAVDRGIPVWGDPGDKKIRECTAFFDGCSFLQPPVKERGKLLVWKRGIMKRVFDPLYPSLRTVGFRGPVTATYVLHRGVPFVCSLMPGAGYSNFALYCVNRGISVEDMIWGSLRKKKESPMKIEGLISGAR